MVISTGVTCRKRSRHLCRKTAGWCAPREVLSLGNRRDLTVTLHDDRAHAALCELDGQAQPNRTRTNNEYFSVEAMHECAPPSLRQLALRSGAARLDHESHPHEASGPASEIARRD
jgi:hypothetical protein